MKKFILLSVAFLSLCNVISFAKVGTVTDSLYSRILGTTVKYNVFVPVGYDEESDETYPAIYLLHGLSGNYNNWEKHAFVHEVAMDMMGSGECVRYVIIMPNAGGKDTHNVQNGYFNVDGWAYEDFFFKELIPQVEKKYHCTGDKGHRAIMGLSMGGGGSTVYCIRHPEMFSSCYAMSAWLDTDVDQTMPKDKFYLTCKGVYDNAPIRLLETADEKTVKSLNTVRWFFDCGDDDALVYLSVDLHKRYQSLGINSQLRVFNGAHTWEYWRRALKDALPFASRNFDK